MLQAVDAGGRFLNLSQGLAPDKLTAETRHIAAWPADQAAPMSASISWSNSNHGPWTTVWALPPKTAQSNDMQGAHTLQWPEVDRKIQSVASGSSPVFVRYQFQNIAMDDVRLATMRRPVAAATQLRVTHCWNANGKPENSTHVSSSEQDSYSVSIPPGSDVQPVALVLSAGPVSPADDACTQQPTL